MSEAVPEREPRRGGNAAGLFTEKIGPLPMWAWVAVIAVILVGWRLYASRKASSSTDSGTAQDTADVPQFVNQTYVQTSAPVQGPAGSPGPAGPPGAPGTPGAPGKAGGSPPPGRVTRYFRVYAGGSTLEQWEQRVVGRWNGQLGQMIPANAAAQKWLATTYKKNKHAKVPVGTVWAYQEGQTPGKAA